jgi:hypothetical protein
MSSTIQFLETLGSNPLSAADYSAVIGALDIAQPEREALLGRDHAALNALLGGRSKMFFGVLAPHEEPLEEEESPFEETPGEAPSESINLR